MIDCAVTGGNDHPDYLPYWPVVARAWRVMGVRPVLAYVGKQPAAAMSEHGTVISVPCPEGMPSAHAAKVARLLVAARLRTQRVILTDLDMLPLDPEYFMKGARHLKQGGLVSYSSDAYGQEGLHPICYLLSHGSTFAEISNPLGLAEVELIESWRGKTDLIKGDPWVGATFCDETLLGCLLDDWKGIVTGLSRGWIHGLAIGRMDRAAWGSIMGGGTLIDAHLPHPADVPEAQRLCGL